MDNSPWKVKVERKGSSFGGRNYNREKKCHQQQNYTTQTSFQMKKYFEGTIAGTILGQNYWRWKFVEKF